ncbi:hypothetical protein GCM10011297_06730 [Bacterioplanes sanyensis]|uniref:GAF domain-containing protein n=1 Tax=Bacterioplanes sanyensis TaxID=1249553 RepID=UPI001678E9DF|nr:GAF domain-containing protein [Bacterioplanes sanyensis]GGY36284.1 hypothetical protein GCM10011297_06730 [Bacterioplanes sanyensis]
MSDAHHWQRAITPAPDSPERAEHYRLLLRQAEALVADEDDLIANLANVAALLYQTLGFWWVGFYLVRQDELVLGPFQGPTACTRIGFGRGVCGSAWQQGATVRVDNVHDFPGHIACSADSLSEIVVPLLHEGKVVAVLDIDSARAQDFSQQDEQALQQLCALLAQCWTQQ